MIAPLYGRRLATSRIADRRAVTLMELLLSVAILSMIAAAMATVTHGVRNTSDFTEGVGTVAQHARVNLDRIARMVREATANEQFPGAAVFATTISGFRYSDTLVVWHPTGTAAAPTGLPQFREIVVYTPHATLPNQLMEITAPSDTRSVPQVSDTTTWATELANMRASTTNRQVLLTDRLRVDQAASGTTNRRGAIRFELELRPSSTSFASYRAGTATWDSMAWPQSFYGSTTGLRQVWVRTEMQLNPGSTVTANAAADLIIPFFGSSSMYYQLSK